MDFLNIAKNRYSCRNYLPRPVEEDKLLKILEASRVAPSAVNFQPWHFIVVRLPENKVLVAEAYHQARQTRY